MDTTKVQKILFKIEHLKGDVLRVQKQAVRLERMIVDLDKDGIVSCTGRSRFEVKYPEHYDAVAKAIEELPDEFESSDLYEELKSGPLGLNLGVAKNALRTMVMRGSLSLTSEGCRRRPNRYRKVAKHRSAQSHTDVNELSEVTSLVPGR